MQWFNKLAVVTALLAGLYYVRDTSDCQWCVYIAVFVLVAAMLDFLRMYMKGGVFHDTTTRLDGKVAIITGANTGIGKETALDLARRGAYVVLACRSKQRGEEAVADIRAALPQNTDVIFMRLDLASFKSVRQFAEEFKKTHKKLHILINNAGIMTPPYMKTEDGFEVQFGVNHLGHFLLTNLLLDELKAAAPSRIVILSSLAHLYGSIKFDDINFEKGYESWEAYGQSKLANVLFAVELTERLKGTGVTANALHPGAVVTDLQRHWKFLEYRVMQWLLAPMFWLLWKGPREGAQTSLYCAVAPEMQNVSGKYFSDCKEKTPSKDAQDKEISKKLWILSEKLVGLKE